MKQNKRHCAGLRSRLLSELRPSSEKWLAGGKPNLKRKHIIHGRGSVVVVRARLGDAREQVAQVQRHDLVVDVDVPGVWRQHLCVCVTLVIFMIMIM